MKSPTKIQKKPLSDRMIKFWPVSSEVNLSVLKVVPLQSVSVSVRMGECECGHTCVYSFVTE